MAKSEDDVVAKAEVPVKFRGDLLFTMLSLYLHNVDQVTKPTRDKATEGDRTEIYAVAA